MLGLMTGFWKLVLHLEEASHTDFTEVARMVLIENGSVVVVVLTTGHTTTTRMLPVLVHSSMTGEDVTAVLRRARLWCGHCGGVGAGTEGDLTEQGEGVPSKAVYKPHSNTPRGN